MNARTIRIASSQQAFGGPTSRDVMSDRTFAVTLAAMLLAVVALPFAPTGDLATDLPVDLVAAQVQPMAPAATAPVLVAPALETVVITRQRPLQQAQASGVQGSAPRS
jgi:hypothetical protein